ncbi:hypothetical protein RI578_06540 [Streptomyces sp. BB1-1-1]|uniref:hypothetical protein n=1 Tax=Streptomyces sp. BB1-1-1 TaxID=3074430 RepID=UPI002877847D|nr:hypothetical protein [Streptomyces sp. BB1-1-1]WND33971.1 hypothetical protein RI578_06540 [Streptomyces sp. BB1-1-1]
MAKDRPWNRQPEPRPTPEPASESDSQFVREPMPELHHPGIAGLQIHDMTDAEVRAYCLAWARMCLARYDITLHRSEDLELAARYAQIAQAFRTD